MLEQIKMNEFAHMLYEAQKQRLPMIALTEQCPEITLDDAYQIQMKVIELKAQDGIKVIGKKIGLTNQAIREQIGVYEPDYATITSEGLYHDGGTLFMDNYIAPRIESEIAFILGSDLTIDMYPIKPCDIIQATYGIAPALEIVDSLIKNWKIKIQDTVSDSASYGGIVLGNKITKLDGLDLRVLGLAAYLNGELVQHGAGAAVMGNPINSLTWLANKCLSLGIELKKGEIILTGSFTPVFDIHENDHVHFIFDHLGEVSLNIR